MDKYHISNEELLHIKAQNAVLGWDEYVSYSRLSIYDAVDSRSTLIWSARFIAWAKS